MFDTYFHIDSQPPIANWSRFMDVCFFNFSLFKRYVILLQIKTMEDELRSAQLKLEEEESSPDYIKKLYNELYQPDSAYKRFIDFYALHGLSFEDWYNLNELRYNIEATCDKEMRIDDFIKTCQEYKANGTISSEQQSAMEKLVAYFRGRGFHYIILF